jgi:hypothetical protein
LRKIPGLSMVGIIAVRQLGPCVCVQLLPRADEELTFSMERRGKRTGAAWGGLFFVFAERHYLGGDDGEHRGRRTETWLRGLHLAEPPPRVMGHPCDRDEAAMETMKAEAGEGDRRRKAGQSVYLKVLEAQMIY